MTNYIDYSKLRVLKENEEGFGIIIDNTGYIDPKIERNSRLVESYSIEQDKDIILYAILQKYDTENKNGRIYPKKVLEANAEKYQKIIEQHRAISELNHPETSIIDLERVSHEIVETWWEGKELWGKLKILTSPGFKRYGYVGNYAPDIAANLLLHGITIGISSRGIGSLKKEGNKNIVQSDFELICFDLVSQPSTPGAYLFADKTLSKVYTENINKNTIISNDIIKSIDNFLL
jgi:hypothetical protein